MILHSLILENFGLYQGVTQFDLAPRKRSGGDTPIVLVGGKNGAGKTTFLEALRLALYGKRALGTRVGQSEYEQYLRSRLNRGGGSLTAAVSLEFDYAEAGVVHRYAVRREWSARSGSVAEAIELEKDGKTITSVPKEEWHSFLQELIPPGLSQLFFFDGEKIQEIADGSGEEEYLADAVRGLLGIELISRLRTDLALYLARHKSQEGSDSLTARLEANIRDIQAAQWHADELFEDSAELTAKREASSRVAEQVRRRFTAEGGDIALGRVKLEAEIQENKANLHSSEAAFRDAANKLMPLAYAPRLLSRFKSALASSLEGSVDIDSMRRVLEKFEKWDGISTTWTAVHRRDFRAFLESTATTDTGSFKDLSDRRSALAVLDLVGTDVRPQAQTLMRSLQSLVAKRDVLEASLARADHAKASAMLDELRDADRNLGSTEAALGAKLEELRLARNAVATLERERSKLLAEQANDEMGSRRNDLGYRAAKTLLEYEAKLLALKLKQLQSEFVRCFAHLARKPDLVAEARIDQSTFTVSLFDASGNLIPKSELSAGEKQIYATAMLWALARTSGRHLPMIIDTPLARLDTEHRSRLIERYFPVASHQVILLSTDTEISNEAMQTLEPFVSHSYQLVYDHAARRSTVSAGYFDVDNEEAGHALQQA
ncbi:DNA sulfur modification protein DndD [Agrobacterium sp. 10MFCol1.1]|uniref:DNA sulfur modification protein DndD n=1 Tax=Agrobacterium sp. 10MFCol1.1 TaxID=1150775 RepID=UPI00035F44D1|nr:DNA sulfur modification protein DndD [Agrobacterium sp. 10MFCol1.1]